MNKNENYRPLKIESWAAASRRCLLFKSVGNVHIDMVPIGATFY